MFNNSNPVRVEFDSEVIQMCENVPEVRMINMYMDHQDNIDDVLNSQTDSNVYYQRQRKVATVDEGSVQHETNRDTSKGKENVAEVDEGSDDADDSSETDDESNPDFVDNEYGIDEDDDDEVFLHEVDMDGEWSGANAEQSVPKPSIVEDFVDNEDMYADSDEEQHLRRTPQSDEESTGYRFPEFNPSCDIGTVEFEGGMQFADSPSFRKALKAISIKERWEICWMKSEKYRIRAICVAENCPFKIYASKMQHKNTLQVNRLDPKHTCSRVWENKGIRSSWLAQTFVEEVKTNPTVPVVSMKATMPVFQRMYICLGACKEGFKAQCRPVIGLDGCHLKSPYGGQLLSAVGLDANNMTWVIAYAQVEIETKDSWIWFLQLLVKDIELENQYGFTFIRHLSTNFSLVYKEKILKDAMWRAAFATTVPEFRRVMEVLRTLDGEAYTLLTERPPRHWSRSHFNTTLKCPILLNNLCESFNSWIMSARCKPIISMMKEIRVKPLAKLETSKKQATDCIAIMSGGPKFQVDTATGGQFIVDLDDRTCLCRNWDLSGVPCKHVVSAINHKRGNGPYTYIDKCYMKETFLKAYENIIQPVNGMDL
ncbi:hypothetical protein PRUPE_7G029200 [Prunus persica]|uniref:SWIM-type domain-containing protein n=1 Tax=Prunus persica TaxID=3760 RepID=A0A251N611_PRUPE|nr:hypothetical protein PRUPE_7G029200 [Prunus persica]